MSLVSVLPRRLFLDDSRPCPPGWLPCRTADDFWYLVDTFVWDDISFDYYLGDSETSVHITGFTLLRWMFDHGHRPTNKPTVHTASPEKRRAMQTYIDSVW